jgi:ABC-type transport system involved in multi-copper enzyme maturation permease subunit
MNTTLTIMTYSLKDYLASLRLFLGFIIVIFLMSSGAFIYSQRYQQQVLDYRGHLIDIDQVLREESRSLANVVTMDLEGFLEPSSLQFVVDAEEDKLPNKIPFTVNLLMSPTREGGVNYMLMPFEGIDWDFIVRVILSFVAIALTYDAISGERARGTMRLIMSNPVPRDKLLTGKFLAALTALTIPLLLGALIAVGVVTIYGGIDLGSQDILRFFLHLVLSIVYISLFVLVGLIVSIFARKSSSSLVVLLLIWVCLVVAVPGMARPVAVISMDLKSKKKFDTEVSRILNSVLQEYEGRDVSHAPLDVAPIDDSEFLWAEMMGKVDAREQELIDHYWKKKMDQARLARKISMISPAGIFQFAGQDLINTGLNRQEDFVKSVNSFRKTLADFGREMDEKDPDSPNILYRTWYMSQRPVDPDIVPRFRDNRRDAGEGLEAGMVGCFWLLAEVLVLFVIAHVGFLRSDVR